MILVVTSEKGVAQFKPSDDNWSLYKHDYLDKHCTSVAINQRKEICVATLDGSLLRFEGGSWNTLGFENPGGSLVALSACPGMENQLYLGASPAKLFLSQDNGDTWSLAPNWNSVPGQENWVYQHPPYMASVSSVEVFPKRPEIIFASICWGGVVATPNGGQQWVARDKDLSQRSFCLRMVPGTKTLWMGSDIGIYLSTDFGKSWVLRNHGLPYLSCRSVAGPNSNDKVAVAVVQRHQDVSSVVVATTDQGASWSLLQGMPSRRLDMGPVVVKFIGRHLFVGFRDGQILATKNLKSWSYVGQLGGAITDFAAL